MERTISKPHEEKWTVSFKEFVGSFLYVLLYFIIIEPYTEPSGQTELLFGGLILSTVYFVIGWYFKPDAFVHLLPVISFIEFLENNNLKYFLLRIGGQLIGAFFAAFAYLLVTGGGTKDYNLMVHPLHPFLSGLFTGILGVVIYLLYLFILRGQQNAAYFRFFIFSIGLGIIFYLTYTLQSITLLNPFGLLLDFLLTNSLFTFNDILIGLAVHCIVPMLFIAGTHFFISGISPKVLNHLK
jgi:glycerol uptake facilitator-like aquaporin